MIFVSRTLHRTRSIMSYEKGFLRSVCLSTALTSVTSTAMVTGCGGKDEDDDDFMTKIKKIISKPDLGSSDFNFKKDIDRVAVDLSSKVHFLKCELHLMFPQNLACHWACCILCPN